MATKFSFKTEKPTGKYRSFSPSYHYIKMNGVWVGEISDSYPHKIRLMVADENSSGGWCWIRLKKESESIADAKAWLNENYEAINKKFPIYINQQA